MHIIQKLGLSLFVIALLIFTAMLGIDNHVLSADNIRKAVDNEYHQNALISQAEEQGILDKAYSTSFAFVPAFKVLLKDAQKSLKAQVKEGLPEGVKKSQVNLPNWKFKDYTFAATRSTNTGPVASNPQLFLLLTFGLGILGGLLYILPKFNLIPGIKHDHIYHRSSTRGLSFGWRAIFLGVATIGTLLYGVYYMGDQYFWPALTAIIALLIIGLVLFYQGSIRRNPSKSASPSITGWLGILTGVFLIGFYVLLYWAPQHITSWIIMVDPVSKMLNGGAASQWFLYGLLYTIVILVMGVRMFAKYRHNRYHLIRTGSVMFFQTAFAFLLPEILVRLNYPYFDFKNIWPLNYTFFFDWNLNNLMNSGGLGLFMLVWGIVLVVIAVPVITYFFGKRWYCSWVCGCGGLAETLGDPYRQLSDKSLRAWRFERWIIHGVLAFAVIMTAMVLYTYFTGEKEVLSFNSNNVRSWYGFVIGAGFAGVVGTGFYPLMGNRVWCRFGCPLAGYLGLVQRFKSRFRITTNGGQCISCGNCSTYCEMGIDVRWYAQRGQDIVRSSCVGCGVCSAVCPRGVLRLENSSEDVNQRATAIRALHITEEGVSLS
ncbi:MAG: 4Fe-4S binding protein [Chitinophagales bacterium]|nr:4Fe-4S binding protein [Chitinophagales bacterium]